MTRQAWTHSKPYHGQPAYSPTARAPCKSSRTSSRGIRVLDERLWAWPLVLRPPNTTTTPAVGAANLRRTAGAAHYQSCPSKPEHVARQGNLTLARAPLRWICQSWYAGPHRDHSGRRSTRAAGRLLSQGVARTRRRRRSSAVDSHSTVTSILTLEAPAVSTQLAQRRGQRALAAEQQQQKGRGIWPAPFAVCPTVGYRSSPVRT